jgi:hypothetical protein
VFIDRAPCTKLHKREQKDRTKTEFPNRVFKDYVATHHTTKSLLCYEEASKQEKLSIHKFSHGQNNPLGC